MTSVLGNFEKWINSHWQLARGRTDDTNHKSTASTIKQSELPGKSISLSKCCAKFQRKASGVCTCMEENSDGVSIPSLMPLGVGLLWNDGARLTVTPGSPFGADEGSGLCLVSSVLETSQSACLSWRMEGLGMSACRGGGSLGGAELRGLVLCRGTGLGETSPSASFWPSIKEHKHDG